MELKFESCRIFFIHLFFIFLDLHLFYMVCKKNIKKFICTVFTLPFVYTVSKISVNVITYTCMLFTWPKFIYMILQLHAPPWPFTLTRLNFENF
jgi:hypothetical protein